MARPIKTQAGNVLEVFLVEGPKTRSGDESAGGNRDVRLAAARTGKNAVEACRHARFDGTERKGLITGEELPLKLNFFFPARPAPPLVQDGCRNPDGFFPLCKSLKQQSGRNRRRLEIGNQNGSVQKNHDSTGVLRPPLRRASRSSRNSASISS